MELEGYQPSTRAPEQGKVSRSSDRELVNSAVGRGSDGGRADTGQDSPPYTNKPDEVEGDDLKGLGVNGEDESDEAALLWGPPSDSDQHKSRQSKRLSFRANMPLSGVRCCILLGFGITVTIIALVCIVVAASVSVAVRQPNNSPPATSGSPPATSGLPPATNGSLPWWKTTVIYQIYPQTFQDTSGSGTGDLNGIMHRLDYLEYLGVRAIWLNPIYYSPMADSGYDVADYTAINPLFGTLEDFKQLLSAAHRKGIKLLMDFVPNHTSDEHAWFKESRSSLDNPKRNWYIWASPSNYSSNGKPVPPNNWYSVFGGSMWEYDETTKQYYLHQFTVQQPDLNFRNPDVLNALDDNLRFWLDLGVDGFRVDAIAHLFEDPLLRNEGLYSNQVEISYNSFYHNYTKDYPEIHAVVHRWRKLLDSYGEKLMIGEIYSDPKNVMSFFGTEEKPEFTFPFNFFLLGNWEWTGISVANVIATWIDNQPEFGWPNWVLGNHDNTRIATKAGPERARLLNVLLLLLPGTPTTYYGEELGMEDVPVPRNLSRDTNTDNPRDKERTPMMWNNTVHAGFTTPDAKPWLPLPNSSVVAKFNVETLKADPKSILSLYHQLVLLRNHPEFQHGMYKNLSATQKTLVFLRYCREGLIVCENRYVVAINFSGDTVTVSADVNSFVPSGKLILSSLMDAANATIPTQSITLRPYEAIVVEGISDKWM